MRKKLVILFVVIFFSNVIYSQYQYEILPDKDGGKLLKGIISKEILLSDSSCSKWYANNSRGFAPNTETVAALKKNNDSIQLLVFLGTWCEDSHFIIPKFYMLLDAAGFSTERVTLIATDRNKKTLSHLAEALNIINVPTIMVMKGGKEVGRVVEYGKYGMFDKELGEIINSIDAGKVK